ncbi:uncharacterized protein PHACADRAFT_252878 [Phanerochaete carnosa HHB-10118-sp]|uniref:F-box domain-containing protein n=1 Tax=Phanerochaete carnosa (strain HHB-10118-sp) TaxID=650164 RepID=K5W3Q1_PHACS|nr:uncharacterized protein PHACADRAFT_252878 [Phanerochaete carnosa HHB-10118-sp]EKM58503.1 hypothetical protein PHACADRAFT_252878 [Phanerochaete carnosa HHB-10118-sp]
MTKLSDKERCENMRSRAVAECERFFRNADLICARPDIAQNIHHLTLSTWGTTDLRRTLWGSPEDVNNLDKLIIGRMRDVAVKTPGVTKLTLENIVLTVELAEAIFALPGLSYLAIIDCTVDFGDREPRNLPARLEHLMLKCYSVLVPHGAHNHWEILHYLPSLRWLCVKGADYVYSLPSDTVIARTAPFATLQRLQIEGLDKTNVADDDEPWKLVMLLHSAPELHLTHVNLHFSDGLPEFETFALIYALQRAPLRLLVLKGIDCAHTHLIEYIAEAFPELFGLTLSYRESPLQQRLREASWPCSSWEYAACLARFSRLEHFGWNYRIEGTASPAVMLHFEGGFCGEGCVHDTVDADFDELETLLPLFAAYCPTLRSLAFEGSGGFPDPLCTIARDAQGKTTFEICRSLPSGRHPKRREHSERYCPETQEAWPLLDSRTSD